MDRRIDVIVESECAGKAIWDAFYASLDDKQRLRFNKYFRVTQIAFTHNTLFTPIGGILGVLKFDEQEKKWVKA